MSDIFISYSRDDSKFVEALIIALIDYGWSVWSDKSGIAEGRPFDQEIENAIARASVTLVVWSRTSVKSRWVRAEASFALDKDKLIPVSADGTDPPLQFLHIQGANLAEWGHTTEEPAFKKLAAMLSERLDRVGRIPKSQEDTATPAAAPAISDLSTTLRKWHEIIFPPVSRGFDQYYTGRTFFISQFACVFSFFLVTLFGLLDFFEKAGGLDQTRFRLLVTGPSLLLLLAISFTPFAKRHSQSFVMLFCSILTLLVYKTTLMVDSAFPVTTGAPTTTFLVLLALMIILPLRTTTAFILGFFVLSAHELYLLKASPRIPASLMAGYSICVVSVWLGLIAGAYFRERGMRRSYLDIDQASSKIAELKDRVLALAMERHQTAAPNSQPSRTGVS